MSTKILLCHIRQLKKYCNININWLIHNDNYDSIISETDLVIYKANGNVSLENKMIYFERQTYLMITKT